jgi:hypothetical protein
MILDVKLGPVSIFLAGYTYLRGPVHMNAQLTLGYTRLERSLQFLRETQKSYT